MGGGGAGGSININCGVLTGSGRIVANGGGGGGTTGGGGGGGRIAVYATDSSFTGSINAYGGGGANFGGAGTVFTQMAGASQLLLDNGSNPRTYTPVQTISGAALNIRNGAKVMATSAVAFNSLLVATNGWLTQLPASSLDLSVSNSAVIQPGGGFTADFLGKAGGQGIAAGRSGVPPYFNCSGGGYGGKGGFAASNAAAGGVNTADTAASPSPTYSGSGGGTYGTSSLGGSGGGFCKLTVGGTLQLDGLISANGGDGAGPGGGGGGAGGGVYLTVGTLTGGGTIRVNGGTGANGGGGGGGGGGGRIAIYLGTNQFSGALTAFGGGGANYGGGGTIYLKTNSFNSAQLIVDNGGNLGADTLYQSSSGTDLILRNGGSCFVSGTVNFGNLTVDSNSWLFVSNNAPSSATLYATSITVQPGGGISADSAGYNANSGNGAGTANGAIPPYFACSGAGHGGYGAGGFSNTVYGGGFFYDTASNPSLAGSGGGNNLPYSPGGKGGGVITLSLQGAIQLNGTLSANGGNGTGIGGGGGSGGSLNISCTKLTGNGVISANGGYGAPSGGGGAGGMIAISTASNLFTGTVSAYGGGGANWGGAGTLFFKTNTTGQSVLVLDNGGHPGTSTPMVLASNFILRNGASGFQSYPPQTISSLLITSNAWLVPGNNSSGMVNLTVNGNATIQSGGGIVTDASGSAQNVGTGHGNYYPSTGWNLCSGAGHGGYGGAAYTNSVSGGATYDSSATPIISGSGGGGQAPYSIGGAGGGLVTLTVNGILQLDGRISANGGNGSGFGGGGGSGGGIRLTQTTLSGTGSITANGGNGANLFGGGGGGGRIAILNTSRTNAFSGNISAYGGGGASYGGAGTIYFGSYYTNPPLLTLDNASHAGTNTTFDFTGTDATIQNGAVGVLPITGSWTPHNLLVHSNAMLIAPASSTVRTINANNVTIDAGGVIALDGAGYAAQTGPGAGLLSPGTPCGGGHGGYGGAYGSSSSSHGGNANDSILSPVMAGSGGGNYNSKIQIGLNGTGGTGGGALQLTANTLTVNGRLSANGMSGGYNAGGGAGGSLYLASINTLTGNGIIAANGGGNSGWAGGGGGGRIALNCVNNTFSGQLSTAGGNGAYPGGAGTIYTSVAGVNTLLVNNGGITSSNGLVAGTPLASNFSMPSSLYNLTISGAATVLPVSPLPLINNLNLATGASIASPDPLSNLFISVLHNADLGGTVTADAFGYAQGNGPGAGGSVTNQGAGGGYGGAGGNSANGATGGMTYGSAPQPVDFGSGGGAGTIFSSGGSAGGGAIHLSVGGTLDLTGSVTANGDAGQQDNSGGGAGGSVWINASTFSGTGSLSAAGGGGNLYNGGGGGGGRIAIYAPNNLFAGTTNVNGGNGANPGQAGTVFLSSVLNGLQIISQTPTGTVSSTVDSVNLSFNEAIDPASLSAATFSLNTPTGLVSAVSMNVAILNAAAVQVSFPAQNLPGDYVITAATSITNIFGQSLAAPFTGTFTIAPPTLAGTVTDTNGDPVANVLVQPDGGLTGTTTDANGDYSITVPPGWTGSLTPSLGSWMFVPGTLSYTNLASSLSGQNFLIVPTIAPGLTTGVSGTSLMINWNGLAGVTYQTWWSTNLVDWSVLGDPLPGTNGLMQISLPLSTDPAEFFRIGASN